jgi:hypothetical protein
VTPITSYFVKRENERGRGRGGNIFHQVKRKKRIIFLFLFTIVYRLIGIHGTAAEG